MNKTNKLQLLNVPKIGRKTAELISENYVDNISSVHEMYELLLDAKNKFPRVSHTSLSDIQKAFDKAEKILDSSIKNDILILSREDIEYPNRYRNIDDSPLILYVKGNIKSLNRERAIAIIGTRQPSNFGVRAGKKLTHYFVENDFTIVSGLALGCDTIAHEACLEKNGFTVAVLASGLDYIYPKKNEDLVKGILDNGGAIISEYSVGTRPRSNFFIERDRLQSGLSDAICIIESDIKGGTMHTYKYATKQGRQVSSLRHPEKYLNDKSRGNQQLIQDGCAYPLGNTEEINLFISEITGNNRENIESKRTVTQLNLFD